MERWILLDKTYNITLSLAFFILMGSMFYLGRRGCKEKNYYGGISSIICGFFFLVFGYYNSVRRYFLYPYNGYMVWWIGMNLLVNFIFFSIIRREKKDMLGENEILNLGNLKSGKNSLIRRYVEKMTKEDPYKKDISFKMELARKSFHLLGLFLLVIYYGFFILPPIALLVSDGVILLVNQIKPLYELLWGEIEHFSYSLGETQAVIDITMMGIIGGLMLVIISDLIRVIWGPEYSIFTFLTKSMLRSKERNAIGPQVYMITGFVFSYMLYMAGVLHPLAVFSGILISCLSDAAAALIGRKFGKHKIQVRSKDTKSIEGFLAGTILAYIIGLIFVGPIYAIIGAIIFFLTDYLPIYTADNILNPIFIPLGLQLFIVIIGLPVGWS